MPTFATRTLVIKRTLLAAALCLAAALPSTVPTALAADGDLVVESPYVRLVPPNAPASGAFMLISNRGGSDRQLVKAESPAARVVELHTHINDGGVMKMRAVPAIEIKAQGQTQLKPGSFHVMLIELKQPLKEGDVVPITLNFDDNTRIQVDAPVQKIAMPAPAGAGHAPMTH